MLDETVKDYFFNIIEKKEILNDLDTILNAPDFNSYNYANLKNFESVFYKIVPRYLRYEIKKKISEDFNINVKIKDHFICRLLSRFKDKAINFVFYDLNSAYKIRNHKKRKNKRVLPGTIYRFIYNEKEDELVSIYENKDLTGFDRRRIKF